MRTLEIILLTKSSKYGGYCVAGIDCTSGKWVRLMSANEETSGAVDDCMMYDAHRRRYAQVLDRVLVDIAQPMATAVQPENILLAQPTNVRILGRASLRDVLALHAHEQRPRIFGSRHHTVEVDVESLGHSLELIEAEDLRLNTIVNSSGKLRYKLDFHHRGASYSTFSVTDPEYYGRGPLEIPRATLVLSISDDEWSRQNGHYIYVAKIFDARETAAVACSPQINPSASKPSSAAPTVAAAIKSTAAPLSRTRAQPGAPAPRSFVAAPTVAAVEKAPAAPQPAALPPSSVPMPIAFARAVAAASEARPAPQPIATSTSVQEAKAPPPTQPSIQPLSRSAKPRRTRRILSLLLAAVLALAILTVACGTSYIAPYSGTRYHKVRSCYGLRNARSVVQRPTLWLRFYAKPCGYCYK